MSNGFKNIVTILGFVLLALLGYYLFVVQNGATLTTNNAAVSEQVELETQDFLRRLNDLKTIDLSTELFNDPRFTNLVEHDTAVRVVPVGRENPFAATN